VETAQAAQVLFFHAQGQAGRGLGPLFAKAKEMLRDAGVKVISPAWFANQLRCSPRSPERGLFYKRCVNTSHQKVPFCKKARFYATIGLSPLLVCFTSFYTFCQYLNKPIVAWLLHFS